MKQKKCTHYGMFYYPKCNEDGWKCTDCGYRPDDSGKRPGFSPKTDRELIDIKVGGLLMDLTQHVELVYVSNGTSGDVITSMVVERCNKEERYDQYSILLFILEIMTPSHAKYWKEQAEELAK